eukprot:768174-Hanusia_phi.AAC.10
MEAGEECRRDDADEEEAEIGGGGQENEYKVDLEGGTRRSLGSYSSIDCVVVDGARRKRFVHKRCPRGTAGVSGVL